MARKRREASLAGGCQCGDVRYEVRGPAIDVYVCHCRECQKQSSSAFGISVIVNSSDLVLLSGEPRIWTRPATLGGSLDCAFCPNCGSRLWHGNPKRDEAISVKGGSLDAPPDLSEVKHIWVSRKLPGVVLPDDAEIHTEEPEPR
ncbi:MAG: GFA family protein [Kiloniellales bacterium]